MSIKKQMKRQAMLEYLRRRVWATAALGFMHVHIDQDWVHARDLRKIEWYESFNLMSMAESA